MKRNILLAALLAIPALAAPVTAPAQQPYSPIQITSCKLLQAVRNAHPFWYPYAPMYAAYSDGISISYVNRSGKTANRVAFEVIYRGDRQRIIDLGTFSPGVAINHQFGQFSGDAWLGPNPNSCRVRAVRFADGTVWKAPR